MKKLYIAYGSNMDEEQMAFRCPTATLVGTAIVEGYELIFKGSRTGSYATIEPKEGSIVPVLVWEIGDKLKMKAGLGENAKTAKTFFRVVKRFEKCSLVSLVIETGRTHQIRFHMSSIGCPLLGDSFYGDGPEMGISRTALHAHRLTYIHPFCQKVMRIESEMPKDLTFLLG